MMQFKENTDLMCILHIDWFLTHDHKTCGILSVIADILSQDLQSVKLSCLSAGNSCLRLVIVFFYLLGRTGSIFHLFLLPVRMRFQIFSTLGKCLRMRTYLSDILQFSIRQSQKYMLRTDDLFSYNTQLILCKKIINISHNTGSCILNGKYRIVCSSLHNCFHCIAPGFYMKTLNIVLEIFPHCSIAVRTFHTLKDNSYIFQRKCIYHFQFLIVLDSMLCEKLILSLTADRHDLLKKLLRTKLIKFSMRLTSQDLQLLSLSFRIQNLLSCTYLIFCNILTHLHSLFKKTYDIAVDLIYFISAFL